MLWLWVKYYVFRFINEQVIKIYMLCILHCSLHYSFQVHISANHWINYSSQAAQHLVQAHTDEEHNKMTHLRHWHIYSWHLGYFPSVYLPVATWFWLCFVIFEGLLSHLWAVCGSLEPASASFVLLPSPWLINIATSNASWFSWPAWRKELYVHKVTYKGQEHSNQFSF